MMVKELIELLEKVQTKDAEVVIMRGHNDQGYYPYRVIVEHDMITDSVHVVIETSENP